MRAPIIALCIILLLTTLAPIFAIQDPAHTQPSNQLQPPNSQHVLGTDFLGRDVLSRLLYGGRRTLLITTLAAGLSIVVGGSIGIAAGVLTSWIDTFLAILINALLAIPNLLVALVVLTLLGGGGISLIIATSFTQMAPVARVIRIEVMRVLAQPYVEAGYAVGLKRWQILIYYVLPNIRNSVLTYGAITFSYCLFNSAALAYLGLGGEPGIADWGIMLPNIRNSVLTYGAITFSYCLFNSAALAYLGLGGEPGIADWGIMLAEGRNTLYDAPWIAIAPGLAITLTIWSINSLFDQVNIFH